MQRPDASTDWRPYRKQPDAKRAVISYRDTPVKNQQDWKRKNQSYGKHAATAGRWDEKASIHRIHIIRIIIWVRILLVAAECTLQRSAHRYIIWARVARMPGMFQGPWSNPILLEKHSHNTHSYLNGHFSSSSRSDEMPSEKVATKVATFILRNA